MYQQLMFFIRKPFILSIGIHLFVFFIFIIILMSEKNRPQRELEFSVIEKVVEKFKVSPTAKKPVIAINRPKNEKNKTGRKVYGLSRKSIESTQGVEVKKGNTLAKNPDNEKLKKDDVDSLPIPAQEFLITAMPKILEEIRPDYPIDAKKEGVQGSVILEILIDAKGTVRSAQVVKSLDPRLDQAAINAIQKFKFRPAMMEDSAVAVKIKYAINFVLEE